MSYINRTTGDFEIPNCHVIRDLKVDNKIETPLIDVTNIETENIEMGQGSIAFENNNIVLDNDNNQGLLYSNNITANEIIGLSNITASVANIDKLTYDTFDVRDDVEDDENRRKIIIARSFGDRCGSGCNIENCLNLINNGMKYFLLYVFRTNDTPTAKWYVAPGVNK